MADATASGGASGATATTPPPSSTPAAAAASRGFGGWFGGLLQEVQGGLSEFVAVVSHDTREQAEKVEKQIEAALHERSVPPTQLASGLLQSVTRGIGRLLADESTESAGPSAANSPARAQVQYVIKGSAPAPAKCCAHAAAAVYMLSRTQLGPVPHGAGGDAPRPRHVHGGTRTE